MNAMWYIVVFVLMFGLGAGFAAGCAFLSIQCDREKRDRGG